MRCRAGAQILVHISISLMETHAPKWVADNEKGDILVVRISQDFIALCFDHVTIRKDQVFSVISFLA